MAKDMVTGGISTPLLDKRSYRVGKRLVRHFDGELEAEAWLAEPRDIPPFRGMTPAAYFEENGEGPFQEITSGWPIEDARRMAARSDGPLELNIPDVAWSRQQSDQNQLRGVKSELNIP